MPDWIGYRWLAERYGVSAVQAFRTDSAIAKSRATVREDGYVHEQYPPVARPAETLSSHLTFALKHDNCDQFQSFVHRNNHDLLTN